MKFIFAAIVATVAFAAGAAAQAELVAAVGTNFAAIPECVKTCLTASAFTVPGAPYDADEITSICTQGLLLSADSSRAASVAGCVNTAEPACSAASGDGSTLRTLLGSVVAPCAQLAGLATGAPVPVTTAAATTAAATTDTNASESASITNASEAASITNASEAVSLTLTPLNSAGPVTSILPDTIITATTNVVSPGLITEPLPPPDDILDSKSTLFVGLNTIPTASSFRADKDDITVPSLTDVQKENAEELTILGSMTLDGSQGLSRYDDKANEARINRVIAPARGSSMMVVTSGAAQRSRNNVASWSCEDVEDWLSENGFAPVVVAKFKSHQIDGYQLLFLSSGRLVEMGITVETLQDNLLYAVERLRVPRSPGVRVSASGRMALANEAPPQYS
ncbi:hypothetical protein BC829DRAFT_418992 [Chytridium lagenaria]|nr:hypothetical protein BC829DRAFT_418992 [Chytridium lagenaria]